MSETKQLHLRRYLLGQLNEQERDELAEEYFTNEELFDELLEIENELFDQCARDELSPAEKKQFAGYVRSLPDGEYKLATAQALLNTANVQTSIAEEKKPDVESVSWWQSLQAFLSGKYLVSQYALGGALLIAVAFMIYFYAKQKDVNRVNEQLLAQRSQAEREKEILEQQAQTSQQKNDAQQTRIQQLEEELEEAKKKQSEAGKDKPQDKEPSTISSIIALFLTPALRSGGTPDILHLKPETRTVSLTARIESREQIMRYRATLQRIDEGVKQILTKDNLKPYGKPQKQQVTLSISAKQLPSGNYKLTLQGRAADGIEIAQDYYFNVVIQK